MAWTVVTYENRSDSSVYLQRCGWPSGRIAERPIHWIIRADVPGGRSHCLGVEHACIGAPPLEVAAGEVREDSVWLVAPCTRHEREGLFRILYRAGDPPEVLESNVFRVQDASSRETRQ
jgi:hypothetical protein